MSGQVGEGVGVGVVLIRLSLRVQELEEKQLEFAALWQRPFGGNCADRIRAIEPSKLAAELRLTSQPTSCSP